MTMTTTIRSLILGLGAAALAACSISTTPNSITVKTQPEFDGAAVSKTATRDWTNEPIEIENANGDVVVSGVPGLTKITVTATPFARADKELEADAQATIADVVTSLTIDESNGRFYVHCTTGSAHGTSAAGNSGCKSFTVQVPAGSAAGGLALKATAHNGSINATNLAAAAGQELLILSDNGTASASGISGGAKVHSENGDVNASISPTQGAVIEASTKNGDVTLSLPANFSADVIQFKIGSGEKVTITGFGADLTAATTSRGTAGTGAASVLLESDFGLDGVTLKAQ
jgi:DUF4097 and DUF4098 domain-containing protein YvlB